LLDLLIPEAGAFYVMDRGYIDFARLYGLNRCAAFFVIRARANLHFRRLYSHPVDPTTGLRCDQTIVLTGEHTPNVYPEKLRRIKYYDAQTGKTLTFLTNNFTLPALTVAQLYRCRWQVELFFKWIKQHLRIKAFFGTTENAVKTQIWIAVSVYVLVAIIKKRLALEISLYTILQVLSLTVFEKMPLIQVLSHSDYIDPNIESSNQLNLFE
jgi:IS4 transposase